MAMFYKVTDQQTLKVGDLLRLNGFGSRIREVTRVISPTQVETQTYCLTIRGLLMIPKRKVTLQARWSENWAEWVTVNPAKPNSAWGLTRVVHGGEGKWIRR